MDVPPPRPPPPPPTAKKLSRPKITLQIPIPETPTSIRSPATGNTMYWDPMRMHGRPPGTPSGVTPHPHVSPYFNPFTHHTKASDFMFKQFEGFKDFTMNTAKSGLSVGEKSAFWVYGKLRFWSKKWFTHLFLSLVLLLYSVAGAIIFMTFEGPNEQVYDKNIMAVRRQMALRIEEVLMVNGTRNIINNLEVQLAEYEADITEYMKHLNDNRVDKGHATWSFWNALFYAGTIYTTIGYGHIAPKTTYGRVATILYAIIGIPLFLLVLADFGKLFTRIIKFFWSFIRRFYYTRSCRKVRRNVPVHEVMRGLEMVYGAVRRPSQIFSEDILATDHPTGHEHSTPDDKTDDIPPPLPPKPGVERQTSMDSNTVQSAPSVFEIDDEFNLPISVAIVILIFYIIIGAFVYTLWEDWTFAESFYFVFISMSTIGLGDYVPVHPIFMMSSILYLIFGLALTSMCINVVQVKLSDTFSKASAKIGASIGLKIAAEDGSLVPTTPKLTEIVPVHTPNKMDSHKQIEATYDDNKEHEPQS